MARKTKNETALPTVEEVVKLWPAPWRARQIAYGRYVVRRRSSERSGRYNPPASVVIRQRLGKLIPLFMVLLLLAGMWWLIVVPHSDSAREARREWHEAKATAAAPGYGSVDNAVVATLTPPPSLLNPP